VKGRNGEEGRNATRESFSKVGTGGRFVQTPHFAGRIREGKGRRGQPDGEGTWPSAFAYGRGKRKRKLLVLATIIERP